MSFRFMFQQFNATSLKLLHWYSASRLISWLWIWNMKLLRLPIRLEAIALIIVVYRYLFALSMSGLRLWLNTRLLFIRVWKASQYTSNPRMVWGLIFTLYMFTNTHTHTRMYEHLSTLCKFIVIFLPQRLLYINSNVAWQKMWDSVLYSELVSQKQIFRAHIVTRITT